MSGHKPDNTLTRDRLKLFENIAFRRLRLIFKIIISAAFLVYVFSIVDLQSFKKALFEIRPGYYLISLGILLVNSCILAFKFKIILAPTPIRQTLLSLLKINFISRFYSLFFTAAMGQGVVRWYQTTKNQEGKLSFLPVLIFERASFIIVLCFFILLSWFFLTSIESRMLGKGILPFALAGLMIPLVLYFISMEVYRSPTPDRHNGHNAHKKNYWQKVRPLFDSFAIFKHQTDLAFASLGVAFLWHFAYLLRVFFLFGAVNIETSLAQLCWMGSLVLFVQLLPVSFNGIGLREGIYAYLFKLAGMPFEKGILVGSLFFTQMLIASAVGGAVVILSRK